MITPDRLELAVGEPSGGMCCFKVCVLLEDKAATSLNLVRLGLILAWVIESEAVWVSYSGLAIDYSASRLRVGCCLADSVVSSISRL
jgi:hypothetical protein